MKLFISLSFLTNFLYKLPFEYFMIIKIIKGYKMKKVLLILIFLSTFIYAKSLNDFKDCSSVELNVNKSLFICGVDKYLIEFSNEQNVQPNIKKIYEVKNGKKNLIQEL